jgi:hypothetical protein
LLIPLPCKQDTDEALANIGKPGVMGADAIGPMETGELLDWLSADGQMFGMQ